MTEKFGEQPLRLPRLGQAYRSPICLLMACGLLFASRIMISKATLDAGATPIEVAFISNIGAGFVLFSLLKAKHIYIPREKRHIILYLVLGLVSVCLPTALQQYVVLHVGPAYTSTVYALSPLLTLSFAAGIGLEKISIRRLIGITLGLAGMMILVQQQVKQIEFGNYEWVVVGLGIPTFAAIGNVIRSAYWPAGTSALAFSCATIGTSSIFLLIIGFVFETPTDWPIFHTAIAYPLGGLVLVAAVSYLMNFRLQEVGGSVFFSQLGYWGTGFGVVLAAILFGDVLTLASIAGLTAIIVGGLLVKVKPVSSQKTKHFKC